jgi:hypothetical protein
LVKLRDRRRLEEYGMKLSAGSKEYQYVMDIMMSNQIKWKS